MVDYLSEIPLPGAMLAPSAAHSAVGSAERPSLGFIAGPENRLVAGTLDRLMHLPIGRIGQQPAPRRVPKVIALFGPSGTGKTHLAHGLVRHWKTQRGAEKAAYLTAGDFYRQLLDAIKRSAVADFRRAFAASSCSQSTICINYQTAITFRRNYDLRSMPVTRAVEQLLSHRAGPRLRCRTSRPMSVAGSPRA